MIKQTWSLSSNGEVCGSLVPVSFFFPALAGRGVIGPCFEIILLYTLIYNIRGTPPTPEKLGGIYGGKGVPSRLGPLLKELSSRRSVFSRACPPLLFKHAYAYISVSAWIPAPCSKLHAPCFWLPLCSLSSLLPGRFLLQASCS